MFEQQNAVRADGEITACPSDEAAGASNLRVKPSPVPPEWIRLPKSGTQCPHSGLSRSVMFGLVREGKIRSVVLRRRGKLRGTRLVEYQSLMTFLRNLD